MISRYLNSGGFFIGTTTNGEYIKNFFKDIKEKVYSTDLFRIQRNFNKTLKSPYGNEYTFTIFDTKDRANYFNTIGLSTEYLVNFKTLEEVAATVGLVPVKLNIFEDYNSYESKSQKVGKQKGFTEIKKNTIPFDDILKMGKWKPKPDSRPLTPEEKEVLQAIQSKALSYQIKPETQSKNITQATVSDLNNLYKVIRDEGFSVTNDKQESIISWCVESGYLDKLPENFDLIDILRIADEQGKIESELLNPENFKEKRVKEVSDTLPDMSHDQAKSIFFGGDTAGSMQENKINKLKIRLNELRGLYV
jgi:hypothetical protein